MAYLRRRPDGRTEIRESVATRAGPRARTLVVFRGPLGPDLLDRAARRARRRFRRDHLVERAAALGIPVSARRQDTSARELLAELRAGSPPDPVLVSLLRAELAPCPAAPVPAELAEVAEWLGRSAAERGRALRGLLRASDRLVRRRPARRARARVRFPRFRSLPDAA